MKNIENTKIDYLNIEKFVGKRDPEKDYGSADANVEMNLL